MVGIVWPTPGQWLSAPGLTFAAIFVIFLIQGLKLDTREARDALLSWRAVLLGLLDILLVSPLLSFPLHVLPLSPPALTVGLCLFVAMPSTIQAGVVFTRLAGGNTSLALLLSLASTLLCIAVLPLTIPAFVLADTGQQADVAAFDAVSFLKNLCLDILLPTVAGKAIRELVPHAPLWIARTDSITRYAASGCLIFLPFVTVSTSSAAIRRLAVADFFLLLLIGAVLHGLLLAANALVCRFGWRLLRLDAGKRIAMILSCSGKSVPIAIAVLPLLGYAADTRGLLAVPLVFAQLTQTIMDSTLANHWASQRSKQLEPEQEQLQEPHSLSAAQQAATANAAADGAGIELASVGDLDDKGALQGTAALVSPDGEQPLKDAV